LANDKRRTNTDPIAMGRIEHGEMVDGKNVVKTFEPGDVVDLKSKDLEPLIACGAVKQLKPEAPEPGVEDGKS
jgi:hypothetical protein